MSTFPGTAVDGRGRSSTGRALEKSNFTQTCNLLSQFLKDKRRSGAFSLGVGAKMEPRVTTMDLLTNLQKSDDALKRKALAMDSLPHFVENPCIKQSNTRSPAPEAPQLTILYAGKVLVFDTFPPEKATEIMELATKLGSDNSGNDKYPPTAPVAMENLNVVKMPQTNTAQEEEAPRPGPQGQAFGSDMRYPRRASLLKFLEKRKERVIARGPYQMNNPKNKDKGSSSGGDPEDQSSKHFDLNL